MNGVSPFLIKYTRKYWIPLLLTVLCIVALVGVQLLAPWIIKTMIKIVTEELDPDAMKTIARLAFLALLVYIARGGLWFARSYISHVAGWGLVADVRTFLYEHLQRLSLRYFEDKQTGQIMSRVVYDSDLLERLVSHAIPDVMANILTLAGITAVLLALNWQLMLLCLVPIPFIILGMIGFTKVVRPAFRERQKELGELNATLNDNLSGIREIQVFTQEEAQAKRVGGHIQRYRASMLRALKMMATFHPFIELSASMGTIVLIYFGGEFILQQTLPIEDLVAFFLYLNIFYQPITALGGAWEQVQESLTGAERVAEILDELPEIKDHPDSVTMKERASGEVRFENVSFHYLEGRPVLQNIDAVIKPGTVTALVGPTGVGKSTFAGLIPRFYDVTEGRISIDGIDIRDIKLSSLRRQISIVLQDVFLFNGSVRENIMFGRASASDEEMRTAAETANAHGFIMELPEGYETMVGERGIKLSGGQKQRIAIARALLADTPILILDEATSSVDTETERLIQQAVERLIAGRTTIVIAHRLSTVRNADSILVLKDCAIAEAGTHSELLRTDGLYRSLVNADL